MGREKSPPYSALSEFQNHLGKRLFLKKGIQYFKNEIADFALFLEL